jgi:acyl carrier protein
MEAGAQRIGQMLTEVAGLVEAGVLDLLPVTAWDVRQVREAFRFMSQARHTGKIVLRVPRAWDRGGTVVITGGTGGLGGLVARHLAAGYGMRHLVLASRRGAQAGGAAALVADLAGLGARVSVVACDVSDRDAVEGLLASVPAEHPVTAVVHAAGVLDDGVIGALDAGRLETVLRPKLDAAWYLHELTAGMDLAGLVLFSSVAGSFGSAGQGNYAAANAGLDGLAEYRRGLGLPAVSVAWGPWEQSGGMTAALTARDLDRMARSGMLPLATGPGLALFDQAVGADSATAVAVRLDARRLRACGLDIPPLLRALVPAGPRRAAAAASAASLRDTLAELPPAERRDVILDLVAAQARVVLGHGADVVIDPGRSFRELGLDSLTAVELRNRLGSETGLRLPATLVFDYPNPGALAERMLVSLIPDADQETMTAAPGVVELQRLEQALRASTFDGTERKNLAIRLKVLLNGLSGASERDDSDEDLDSASDDELFAIFD